MEMLQKNKNKKQSVMVQTITILYVFVCSFFGDIRKTISIVPVPFKTSSIFTSLHDGRIILVLPHFNLTLTPPLPLITLYFHLQPLHDFFFPNLCVITWLLTGNCRTEAQEEEVIVAEQKKKKKLLCVCVWEGKEGGKQRCPVAVNKVIERWILFVVFLAATCCSIFSASVQANSLVVNQGSQLAEVEEHSAFSTSIKGRWRWRRWWWGWGWGW